MTLKEIKNSLDTLTRPPSELTEYQKCFFTRLRDFDHEHWLPLKEFERKLGELQSDSKPPYEITLHVDLLSAIQKSGTQRVLLLDFIRKLHEHPDTDERQIKIVGDYAVIYWVYDSLGQVTVVDISHIEK